MSQDSEVRIVYVLQKPEDRPAFLNLMSELRAVTTHLMATAGADASAYTMTERSDREGWFMEVLRFPTEQERNRFDTLYSQDRKASALQALIDGLVDPSRSDYLVRRGPHAVSGTARSDRAPTTAGKRRRSS